MAAKTTLNAKNLEALGAQRLAELLIEISTGSAANKRRLRMELAGNQGSVEVAREVRKRLGSIARARSSITWRKVKALKADLETQRKTIVDNVATDDPKEAFELIWQFLALADSIFERSDDGSGPLVESFHQACADAGLIAEAAEIDVNALAEKIFAALQDNSYGQYDRLITAMAAALGSDGLEYLKLLFVRWENEPQEKPAEEDREIIGWGVGGPVYIDGIHGNNRARTTRMALEEIADVQGDADAYVAVQEEQALEMPMVATGIANRFLAAGRAEEALQSLDKVVFKRRDYVPYEWQLARSEALDALERSDEAQAYRWTCFEQSLSQAHLRAHLRRLPDFDDMEAEDKAFAYVQGFPDVHAALTFFLVWPAVAEAARLVIARGSGLDGNLYELMTRASEALAEKSPLAAMIVLRAMIDFTLDNARTSRYKHAARHLAECGALAPQIDDYGAIKSHDAYVADLQRRHGKKHGFWSRVS